MGRLDGSNRLLLKAAIATVGAAGAALAHLYLADHPGVASPPLRLLATLYDVAVWGVLATLLLALGLKVNTALGVRAAGRLERAVYGWGSGAVVASLVLTGLAFSGLTSWPLVLALLAAAIGWLWREMRRLVRGLRAALDPRL